MAGRLQGKVALITGAARGQGRSHAVTMAAEGADIIAVDICQPVRNVPYQGASPEDLEITVKEVEAAGGKILARQVDVRDADGLREVVKDGVGEFGHLDVAVANAGICILAPWHEQTPEIWQDTLDINLTGCWNVINAAAPQMIAQGNGGSIIMTSSAAGLKGLPFLAPYVAAKHGLTGLGRAMAAELAQHKIRVNTIHPCGVDTEMTSEAGNAGIMKGGAENPRVLGILTNMLEIDKLQPIEISHAVVYLASDESRYVTALAMAVDAGNTQY